MGLSSAKTFSGWLDHHLGGSLEGTWSHVTHRTLSNAFAWQRTPQRLAGGINRSSLIQGKDEGSALLFRCFGQDRSPGPLLLAPHSPAR